MYDIKVCNKHTKTIYTEIIVTQLKKKKRSELLLSKYAENNHP